jgi:hypothetical protein
MEIMIYHRPAPRFTRIALSGLLLVSPLHAQAPGTADGSGDALQPDSVAASDTARLDAAADFAVATPPPAAPTAEAEGPPPNIVPQDRLFTLFDYSEIISFGLSLDYLYYNEDIDLNDEIRSFTDRFGRPPQFFGAPKSTEYGFALGLHGRAAFYSLENKLFLRPRAALLLGFGNTYDGSLQGQPVLNSTGDTIGLGYAPYKFTKNNFFLHAACDLGYSFPYFKFPFVIYTGLDFKLWYRDLIDNQGVLYYTTNVANSETYYWLGVPLGVLVTRPVSQKLVLGMDASVTVMLAGGMSVAMTAADGSPLKYPGVALGNRASLKAELFVQKKVDDRLSMRFAPYFLWYAFGKSNTETASSGGGASDNQTFFEPPSNSFLAGFILTWDVLWKRLY